MPRPPRRPDALDRRRFLKTLGAAGLAAGAVPLVAACGPAPAEAKGKNLVLRIDVDMQNLDPAFATGRSDYEIMECLHEGLQSYRPGTMDRVNTLAEEFQVSPDGLRVDFTLRRGVPFHAGYGEVTAQDVKFSYERIAGLTTPNINSSYQGDWSALEEVQVTGRYSGVIRLKHLFAPLHRTTLPLERGYVLSERAVRERGDGFATAPVGTGPYELVEWSPRDRAVLRRFAEYGGSRYGYVPPVYWDEIQFRPVFNSTSAATALTAGELDFGPVNPLDERRFAGDAGYQTLRQATFDYSLIGMNVAHPTLRDVRVRQAVRAAIDVDAILAAAFEGAYRRATAIIPPNMSVGYWPDAPAHRRDVDAARRLLADAGAQDLQLTITSSTDQQDPQDVCQIVAANLADAGVRCTIDVQDAGTFWTLGGDVQSQRQLFYLSFAGLPDPYWSMVWFTSDQLNQWNFQSFSDPSFDALQRQTSQTTDDAARQAGYVEMQRQWDAAANTVWLAWPQVLFAGRTGLVPSLRVDGRMLAWNFREAG